MTARQGVVHKCRKALQVYGRQVRARRSRTQVAHDTRWEDEEEKAEVRERLEEEEGVQAEAAPQEQPSPPPEEVPAHNPTQVQPQEALIPVVYDRWGNAIQALGYEYRVSQQPKWLQEALQAKEP